jgi:hypothetical protein
VCATTAMDGFVLSLLRREDMLAVDFTFENLSRTRDRAGREVLVPTDPAWPSVLTAIFPPQAILEAAFAEGVEDVPPLAGGLAGARLSWVSQLAFSVPHGKPIPFSAAGLLTWTGLRTVPERTRVECVWDLALKPAGADVTWAHARRPLTSPAGVTELWQTRLRPRDRFGQPDHGARGPMPLAGMCAWEAALPFPSSLTFDQRRLIERAVELRPVQAYELALGALGATVDLVGQWEGLPVAVTNWRHRAVLGRDQDVRVSELGYLFPFGFPAQLVTRTERRLARRVALLRQRHTLTILRTDVSYEGAVGLPNRGRGFPFRRAHLHGPLTLSVSTADPLDGPTFWVRRPEDPPGARVLFDLTAEDWAGQHVNFSAPVAFVVRALAFGGLAEAARKYTAERGQVPLPVAGRLALVPTAAADTTVDVTALRIGAQPATATPLELQRADQLAAFPLLGGVDAQVPALAAFPSPDPAGPAPTLPALPALPRPRPLVLDDKYVTEGLGAAGIYARLPQPARFAPPVTSAGGVAGLAYPVRGLSRVAGLVGGDLEAFRRGMFDPKAFLAHNQPDLAALGLKPPKLLGFIPLPELVERGLIGDGVSAPHVTTEVLHPGGDRMRPPEAVRARVTWRPRLKTGDLLLLRTNRNSTLDLRSTTLVHLAGGEPVSEVSGELRAFELVFGGALPLLIVRFERVAFLSRSGAKPSLDVKVADVQLGRELRFLDRLRAYLPSPGAGPKVTVRADAIEATMTIAVPTLSVGVLLLSNLAVSATFTLPFDGPVRARFAVSSRDHPFLVTVSLFGGGGFFAVTVGPDGIEALEAQLEFGAATALNLGVVSASVTVTAGIYFRYGDGILHISGFFRAVGMVDLLGIVTVSVEIYLALEYREEPKLPGDLHGPKHSRFLGRGSVTVRVKVAFFSQSITLSLERSFGGGSDPTFDLAFPTATPWRDYCAAFDRMAGP